MGTVRRQALYSITGSEMSYLRGCVLGAFIGGVGMGLFVTGSLVVFFSLGHAVSLLPLTYAAGMGLLAGLSVRDHARCLHRVVLESEPAEANEEDR